MMTFARPLMKFSPYREGPEQKVMVTGAKKWDPLHNLRTGQEVYTALFTLAGTVS